MDDIKVDESPITEPLQLPREVIPEDFKRKALQNSIYNLINQQPFYGGLLQEMTLKYNEMVPTAGITYNVKQSQYEIYINPYFFCSISNEERVAVLQHEILHFTNKHLFRLPFLDKQISNEDKKLYNIAGDGAINQFIKNLPKGCVDINEWKMDDGTPFAPFQNMEHYYDLIKDQAKKQKESEDNKGKPDKDGKIGNGTAGNVNDQLDKFKEFDTHFWDSLDEETKKKMLDEAKKIIKRTIEKISYSHSNVPDSIKDLLIEIDAIHGKINCKQILRDVIKKTVSAVEREPTWKRPNRRYGVYSPGSKVGNLPNLSCYGDTSGSISLKELNSFMHIISEFLKVGSRNCMLGLWHTNLYYKKKYKLHQELNKEDLQSGGTDVSGVLEDIKKTTPNLSIILTDGYYDVSNIKTTTEILWVISEGGNKEHPMKHIGKTIYLENLK